MLLVVQFTLVSQGFLIFPFFICPPYLRKALHPLCIPSVPLKWFLPETVTFPIASAVSARVLDQGFNGGQMFSF